MSRLDEARRSLDQARAQRADAPPNLFDQATLDDVIEQVAEHAGQAWREHALEAVRRAAHEHEVLSTDEIRPYITMQTYDLRALGAVMKRAARDGLIQRIPGAFAISARPENHQRPVGLWRSRVFADAA